MTWTRGQSGNPNGRPAGAGNKEIGELKAAVKAASKKKRKSIFKHFVERAYVNDNVLIALMKKFLPDKKQVDADFAGDLNIIIKEKFKERKRGNKT